RSEHLITGMTEKSQNGTSTQENFREFCAIGNLEGVRDLLNKGMAVNSQNAMNGWTGLHWASKREHKSIVELLLQHGADPSVANSAGETAGQVTGSADIQRVLGATPSENKRSELPIVPNYISNPVFPHVQDPRAGNMVDRVNSIGETRQSRTEHITNGPIAKKEYSNNPSEIVLKARVANAVETDFIEIELEWAKQTYDTLLNLMCHELGVNKALVFKIRKMPNTIVRKDKDVQRLTDFQELELVLTNKATSEMSRNYVTSNGPSLREVNIVY
ncbi:unnamed protein product, partial [Owenia fusiformis]